ncbi:MAG: minor capsid protein [Butyricicoccus sp.]
MKHAEYWRERFQLLEQAANRSAEQSITRLERMYREAEREVIRDMESWYARFADNNQISVAEARRLLNTKELEEFRWTVDRYIEIGQQEGLSEEWLRKLENASAKFHVSRLEAVQMQIQQQLERLYGNQLDELDTLLRGVVSEGYTRGGYEVMKGLGIGWDFTALSQKQLDALLSKPWTSDGRTFTDRCWMGKQELLNGLQADLMQGMLRGDGLRKTTDRISKRFGASKYKAGRLAHTETTYFNGVANEQLYADIGVKHVEIIETLDSSTCDICAPLDGKIVPMSEYQPGITVPPFHPHCRGTTAPAIDESIIGERAARNEDGEVYSVPSDMTFEDWKKTFVDGGNKGGLTAMDIDGIMKATFESPELLNRHYEKHRKEFGDITPEEYLERANQLLHEELSEDVEQIVRSDGSISKYKFSTNEFLVVTVDEFIRTYFLPTDKEKYWEDEHARN